MLLVKLWNFIRGYVIISVNGYFAEKFINLCANKGIYLWDIKKKLHNSTVLKISINGFKELRGITKKTRCKIKILRKVGLPFIKHRYRKRKTFLVGFVLFLGILYFLTSFIWVIEINGVENVNPQRIINFLDQNGIKPGILKFQINKKAIIPKMLIDVDDLAWADISVVGTKFIVNVKERIPKTETVDRTTPCSIYAKNYGVIKSIIAKSGKAMVKEGDVVKKGQMLISGVIDNKFHPELPLIVHADGEVKAVTWYQDSEVANFEYIKREKTGQYKIGIGLNLFSFYFDIIGKQSPYKYFDKEEKNIRLALTQNNQLPFEIITKKYYELKYNKYTLSEEQAKEQAKNDAFQKLQSSLSKDIEIVNKKVEFVNVENAVQVNATFECIENIGYEEKITN